MHKAVTAFAIVGLLGLAGCGGTPDATRTVPAVSRSALAGQITARPCVYKEKDEKHKEAEFAARCGFIYVPEDRTKPNSRLIALPYQRILARSRHPAEPLFALAGGPGMSNMQFGLPVSWFVDRRDVVLVGYRGVDGTVRLDCPEVDAVMKGGGALLDSPAIAKLGEAYRQCAARHRKAGVDLDGYTVLEVVDDLEAARRALGYDRIDLSSISYGTRIALIYGWRYPQHVLRSAMIGVNPPGRFRFDPALFDDHVRRYAALCAADAHCAARTKDLVADIHKALDNMPDRWLGFPVNRDVVLISTFMGLFSTDSAAATFDMWIAAAKGDYSGMALVSAAYAMILPPMQWGDFAAKGNSDIGPHSNFAADLTPGRYLIGAPMNVFACAVVKGWPLRAIPAEYRTARRSEVATLMLSGTLDVSTPAETARNELLPLMPNARQVTLAEFSHADDLINFQPGATRHLLTTFYKTGRVDASQFKYRPVDFDPGGMSFPLLAKALVAIALFAIAAVMGLAVWLFRRRRKVR